jgi:hypothetical protein
MHWLAGSLAGKLTRNGHVGQLPSIVRCRYHANALIEISAATLVNTRSFVIYLSAAKSSFRLLKTRP